MRFFCSKVSPAKSAIFVIANLVLITSLGCSKPSPTDTEQVGKSQQLEPMTFQLHWIPDAHQLGFWVALDKGFYKEQGLDVKVQAGGLDANPVKDVLSGAAQIGQVGGIEQVVTAVSQDLPLKAIGSIHRETPHALISLATNPITKPEDFKGKKIAVAYGDTAEVLLNTYLAKAHIDKATIKFEPFRFDLTPLMTGQVDAITGFATAQPATIEKLGKKPVVLSYSSLGVSSYGYTLIASNQTLQNNPKLIQRFNDASREGWSYAFAHPQESILLFKKRFGTNVDVDLTTRELELIKPLMTEKSDGKLSSWQLDAGRVNGVIQYLKEGSQIKASPSAQSVYDNSYTQ